MKLAFREIESFVKKPTPQAQAVLIYGPDEGLVRERLALLTRTVVEDLNDAFNITDLSAAALADDPAKLIDEAKSISMLGGRRVVRVRDASDSLQKPMETLLAELAAGDNLVLVEAGELGPRSSLRLLFERAENAVALPCYVDDARNISQVMATQLREAGYGIDPAALQIMAANVQGDRGVARSEVEKLITYLGDGAKERRITVEDVMACSGDGGLLSFDDLARAVAGGLFVEADRVLNQLLSEGVLPVTILRVLQNHFTRLHLVKSRLARGDGLEPVLNSLKPPLFFKVKDAFVHQVKTWEAVNLERALAILRQAEAECKRTGLPADTVCARCVFTLSMAAQRLARSNSRRYA